MSFIFILTQSEKYVAIDFNKYLLSFMLAQFVLMYSFTEPQKYIIGHLYCHSNAMESIKCLLSGVSHAIRLG